MKGHDIIAIGASAMAELDLDAIQGDDRSGTPSGFACLESAGVLVERAGDLVVEGGPG